MDLGRAAPAWRRRRGSPGASLSLASFSIWRQRCDVFLMLVERLGEGVAAGPVGDEIEILRARGIGDRLHRRLAGIGDRPGRQTVDDVGVVGRRLIEFALGYAVPERSLAADQAVDDRRIGFELHPLLQAVDEDAGDMRALVRLARLLFDDRGERHQFARRFDRQIGRALLPDFVDRLGLRAAPSTLRTLARDTPRSNS